MANLYYLTVINKTANALTVAGCRGTDLSSVPINQTIPANGSLVVATFNGGGIGDDNWDWIYFTDAANSNSSYQIYCEEGLQGQKYAFFGYCDPDSSQSNGNPTPFPEGCSDAAPYTYVLLQTPPAKNLCKTIPNCQ